MEILRLRLKLVDLTAVKPQRWINAPPSARPYSTDRICSLHLDNLLWTTAINNVCLDVFYFISMY